MPVLFFTKGPVSFILPQIWHSLVCRVFGIRVRIEGTPFTIAQTMYMSNHISYLDIPVIGSVLRCSFVAKKDVQSWPLFGFLSQLQQTQFLDRQRTAIARETNSLATRVGKGHSMIIFAEGTSTDGRTVLPFKSSLFSLAVGGQESNEAPLYIQPLTIKVEYVDGKRPETQAERDIYSWHRDMDTDLATHLWGFALHKGADITLIFHEAFKASQFTNRKILAQTCHETVSKGLEARLAA
jgi:1-acyl-sn-glycerol-3-phosphate acyltransferase